MSISSAVNISLTGLTLTQRELDLVAGNIANADTPGYTRKTLATANIADTDGGSIGVREVTVQRAYDSYVMAQYRNSITDARNLDILAGFQSRLDSMFGQPGDVNALDTLFNEFTASLEALAATPEDFTTRSEVLGDAQALATQLNTLSAEIQSMREEAERALSEGVNTVNRLLGDLQDVNTQVIAYASTGRSPAGLLDERDQIVTRLSELIDLRAVEDSNGAVRLFTESGTLLFDGNAATFDFDAAGTITPQSTWTSDATTRGVGTITMTSQTGYTVDMIAQGTFRSGELKAYIDLRDSILVDAQAQIDELADAMSLALSNRTETGTAVTVGTDNGFDIDLTGLQQGNSITLEYVDVATSTTERVTFIRVDDTTLLPLDDTATADPDDTVYGIDFSGGLTAAAADIATALGAGFTVSDEGGNVLRILDDGDVTTTASSLTASITNTALTDEGEELPFFIDGGSGQAYTASLEGTVQKTGYAGRIAVNSDLITDPSRLVVYETGPETPSGDSTRPSLMVDRLGETSYTFSADTAIGSTSSPFSGTVSGFVRQIVNFRGSAMESANQAADAQGIVVTALAERNDAATKVDIDHELALLLELQTAYSANARVMQVAREMIDALMRV